MLIKEAAKQAAESVLAAYWNRGFPVDPTAIATQLDVIVAKGDLPANTSGMIMKRPNELARILVDRSDSEMRQRFTVAHELGHYIERTDIQPTPDEDFGFVDLRDSRNHDPHEFFANEFAGNLLMPESEVRMQAGRGLDAIRLARHFGVSIPAIKTRLMKLGLPA